MRFLKFQVLFRNSTFPTTVTNSSFSSSRTNSNQVRITSCLLVVLLSKDGDSRKDSHNHPRASSNIGNNTTLKYTISTTQLLSSYPVSEMLSSPHPVVMTVMADMDGELGNLEPLRRQTSQHVCKGASSRSSREWEDPF